MNFIETLLGFSPDNNSGSTEGALVLALIVALIIVAIAYRRRRVGKSI